MKYQSLLMPAVIVTLTGATLLLGARQENGEADDTPLAPPATTRTSASEAPDPLPQSREPNRTGPSAKPAKLSYGLDEIAKMTAAGVDPEVVQAFIENSTIAYSPNADDIVRLRELGAPSQVVATLIRHGGQLRERGIQESRAAQAQLTQASTPANYSAPSSSVSTPQAASVTYNVFNPGSPAVAYPVYPTYNYVAPASACYPRYSYSYPRYYYPRHYFPGYYNSCRPFAGFGYYRPGFVRYGVGFGSHRVCGIGPRFRASVRF